jgi:hypothetical protein
LGIPDLFYCMLFSGSIRELCRPCFTRLTVRSEVAPLDWTEFRIS